MREKGGWIDSCGRPGRGWQRKMCKMKRRHSMGKAEGLNGGKTDVSNAAHDTEKNGGRKWSIKWKKKEKKRVLYLCVDE